MDYKRAIEFIESVSWKGSVPGLERIRELCELLGHPERKVKFIHVAGTNGKGSVSAIVASVLNAAGYKTGLFTSPHLIEYTERFAVNGKNITKKAFCEAAAAVNAQSSKMADAPTEFEILTAMAFVYFASQRCDVAVLECGMGGRLDATNVIESPLLSVITNIALDHTFVLGSTELEIAREKAGIIKDAPLVAGAVSSDVEKYLKGVCKKKYAPYHASPEADIDNVELSSDGISFDFKDKRMILPLVGEYQRINLRTALTAIEVLSSAGYEISVDDIACGVASVRWIGRFERLSRDPLVIFDGAHNPDGASFAVATYKELFGDVKAAVVTGVMADKDYEKIADIISSVAISVFAVSPDNPRALPASELAAVYSRRKVPSVGYPTVTDGVKAALRYAKKNGCPVLCVGSLYMYSQIVSALKK